MEDSRKAQMRLITARDRANVLTSDISSLETRIASLTTELENKRAVLRAAKEEVDDMKVRIQYNLDKRNGLCIRYVQALRISQLMN
jgi:outer membrane murein-binding lipoprotein Lpp